MSPTILEIKLSELTENQWEEVLKELKPSIHKVDRDATDIWYAFYPLALHRFLERAEDPEKAAQEFVLQGKYKLSDNIDESHDFLYGHRFWADVKHAIAARAEAFDKEELNLLEEMRAIAKSVSAGSNVEESLVVGITFVGLMTLNQTGLEKFSETPRDISKPKGILSGSPDQIIESRSKEPGQGFFGFLKTIDKEYKVRWDENDKKATFKVIHDEEIASGAARDQSREWRARDERCKEGEGVIPVECRAAACGTCWVGVIGGAEKLSDVERLEKKQVKVFGYKQEEEARPTIRLACQARAEGSVSIVLPPWNGVFGKKIYGVEEVRLRPATSTAAKQRQAIAEALSENE
ncbi:MAG: (2Fe-2S)-binding protein [Pyrinomonadaceae bacterium]|nr:(2Fe-2S)-binding protein [Pyrinomonadaceae bacterium]